MHKHPPSHLPGLEATERRGDRVGETPSGQEFSVPRLGPSEAGSVASTVRKAALEARRERRLGQVIEACSRAGRRLADPETAAGRRAARLLADELGWAEPLARETLDGMAELWRSEALTSTLREELGDPAVLDGWVEAPPAGKRGGERRLRRRRAAGPPLLFLVHAGNVPGVAVTATIRGLLVRSGVLCKAPAAEPGLLAAFARELAREDPLLGRCVATTWWPGGEAAAEEQAWSERAGTVVLYGGEAATDAYRRRLGPATELVIYGPKVGLGAVLPDAARSGEGAAGLAEDVCAYEQAGCVSPRVIYVMAEDPMPWARELAGALEAETSRLPRPEPDPGQAAAVRSVRARAEFRGYASEDGRPRVLADDRSMAWTVLVGGDPAPRTEGLPRVVRVHGLDAVAELGSLLAPLEGRVQALGYAGSEGVEELVELAHRLGVGRVAPFGTVAWPPADWRHDGRPQILPLLRWTDWES